MDYKKLSKIANALQQANSQPICDMARVGFMNCGGSFEVYVRTDDSGFIPHVHVWSKDSRGKRFETCVQLQTNDYFLHGTYCDKFNQKQKDAFDVLMRSKPNNRRYDTYYEYACDMWNDNNSSQNVSIKYNADGTPIIPNYRRLP